MLRGNIWGPKRWATFPPGSATQQRNFAAEVALCLCRKLVKVSLHSRRLRWEDIDKVGTSDVVGFGSLKSVTSARCIIPTHPKTPSSPYWLSTPLESPHRVNNLGHALFSTRIRLDPISKHRDIDRSLSFEIKSVE
jgi:hypothetical protein